jgi:preprotein translocase subunit SecE
MIDYLKTNWISSSIWAAAVLMAIYLLMRYRAPIKRFLSEVVIELQKASWPWDPQERGLRRFKELFDSTTVVIVSTILLAAYVTASDLVLNTVIGFLTKYSRPL